MFMSLNVPTSFKLKKIIWKQDPLVKEKECKDGENKDESGREGFHFFSLFLSFSPFGARSVLDARVAGGHSHRTPSHSMMALSMPRAYACSLLRQACVPLRNRVQHYLLEHYTKNILVLHEHNVLFHNITSSILMNTFRF
jgi:hypothetical protein